jgi:glycosyltransferase involved in cell wall biosynthesis
VKLFIFATHPIQYQVPIYVELAKQVDLLVLYSYEQTAKGQADAGFNVAFEWDVPLLEGYRHHYLKNVAQHPTTRSYKGIVIEEEEVKKLIAKEQPDFAIIHGWYPFAMRQAAKWCRAAGVATFCRGDSHLLMHTPRWKKLAKRFLMRSVLNQFDYFLYVGKANHAFYRHYGVKEERLFPAFHCVNTPYFEKEFEKVRVKEHKAPYHIGFAGKLIDLKRPFDLLHAIATSNHKTRIRLIVIGDGPLMEPLKEEALKLGVEVDFKGFLNQSEIVERGYAALDALVLPSETETWGLVVNEVMTGGIPVVVSDKVGCRLDLVENGRTGFSFEVGNRSDLSRRLDALIEAFDQGQMTSKEVKAKVAAYSLFETVKGYLKALRSV